MKHLRTILVAAVILPAVQATAKPAPGPYPPDPRRLAFPGVSTPPNPPLVLAYDSPRPIMRPESEALRHGISQSELDRDREWHRAYSRVQRQLIEAESRASFFAVMGVFGGVIIGLLAGVALALCAYSPSQQFGPVPAGPVGKKGAK